MIEITHIEENAPNALKKAKREKPWITRLAARMYKIVPRARSKAKRIVTFKVEGTGRASRRFAECRDAQTLELCPAVKDGKCCYHIGTAYRRHLTNARRDRSRNQQFAVATL